jgi:hypothetical protein
MRRFLLLLPLIGCITSSNPYEEGGAWPVDPCSQGELAAAAEIREEVIGGTTRDFALYDQFAYKVRLSSFCGHNVLISVGAMSNPDDLAWLERIPEIQQGRLPSAPPLTILTTWFDGPEGRAPEIVDLRKFAEQRDLDVPVLRDAPRFENAARAASIFWLASDLEEPELRYRQEWEIATRWRVRDTPYFVVLHPELVIVAAGTDLDEDCIVEAAQTTPDLFVPCVEPDP